MQSLIIVGGNWKRVISIDFNFKKRYLKEFSYLYTWKTCENSILLLVKIGIDSFHNVFGNFWEFESVVLSYNAPCFLNSICQLVNLSLHNHDIMIDKDSVHFKCWTLIKVEVINYKINSNEVIQWWLNPTDNENYQTFGIQN